MLEGDGGPGKALDQGALDGAQPIGAPEITFDIGDKAIECLGRASAAVELAARKQLPRVALCERRPSWFRLGFRVGIPSQIEWHQLRVCQNLTAPKGPKNRQIRLLERAPSFSPFNGF